MIPQDKLIEYASEYFKAEIEKIVELLKDDSIDPAEKDTLRKLLKEYELDLEDAERELDAIKREWL